MRVARMRRVPPAAPPGFLTVLDISDRLDRDEEIVRNWIRRGQLPAQVQHGVTQQPRYVVSVADFERFQQARGGMR